MMGGSGQITTILVSHRENHSVAMKMLFPLVYEELRRMARGQRRRMSLETLNTTGLVHEAYLKLVDQTQANWQDRSHFYAVCAIAMRHILINHAEKSHAKKRGGGCRHVEFHDELVASDVAVDTLLDVNKALQWLEGVDKRLASIVEYRFFGGMTETEIARVLDCADRTVRRDWRKAKALLCWALSNPKEQQKAVAPSH